MAELGDFHVNPKDKLFSFLSSRLQRLAEFNDSCRIMLGVQGMTVFDCLARPTISMQSYLERIVTHADCSPACFILAFIYLHRFSDHMFINSFNVHRIFLTSLMVAVKFLDGINDSSYYAKLGGIKTAGFMNILERAFLSGLSYRLFVTPDTFYSYCQFLHREMLLESPPLCPPIAAPDPLNLSIAVSKRRIKVSYPEGKNREPFD